MVACASHLKYLHMTLLNCNCWVTSRGAVLRSPTVAVSHLFPALEKHSVPTFPPHQSFTRFVSLLKTESPAPQHVHYVMLPAVRGNFKQSMSSTCGVKTRILVSVSTWRTPVFSLRATYLWPCGEQRAFPRRRQPSKQGSDLVKAIYFRQVGRTNTSLPPFCLLSPTASESTTYNDGKFTESVVQGCLFLFNYRALLH